MASHAQRTLFTIMRPATIWRQGIGMIIALVALTFAFNPIAAQSNEKATPAASTSESANVVQSFEALDQSDSIDLSSSAGYNWELRPENGTWQPVKVPEGGWKTQGFKCDAGTYRTHIRVPESATGHVVRLVFAAVNFGAVVLAGPDEAHL